MGKRSKINFLDLIPECSARFLWEIAEDEKVVILIPHRGLYDRLAQRLRKTPQYTRILLDEYGSFVWKLIDGQRSVFEIGAQLDERFGEQAQPLYPRLVRFFQILKDQRFVSLRVCEGITVQTNSHKFIKK